MNRAVVLRELAKMPVGRTRLGRLVLSTVIFVGLIALFGYIAREVTEGETFTRDTAILLSINAHSNSFLDTLALMVTYTGNILSVLVIVALIEWYVIKRKLWRTATQVAFTMGGVLVLNTLLKLIFQRDRPELWQLLTHESTYSFPSGHAMITSALATLLIILCWKTKFRYVMLAAGVTYTTCVGLSRLYLGVHYPTDVLAGWLVGTAWAIIVGIIIGVVTIRGQSTKNV